MKIKSSGMEKTALTTFDISSTEVHWHSTPDVRILWTCVNTDMVYGFDVNECPQWFLIQMLPCVFFICLLHSILCCQIIMLRSQKLLKKLFLCLTWRPLHRLFCPLERLRIVFTDMRHRRPVIICLTRQQDWWLSVNVTVEKIISWQRQNQHVCCHTGHDDDWSSDDWSWACSFPCQGRRPDLIW